MNIVDTIRNLSVSEILGFSCLAMALQQLYCLLAELRFYHRSNWDFSIPSGRKVYGSNGQKELSNRTRVTLAYPMGVAMCSFFGCLFLTI